MQQGQHDYYDILFFWYPIQLLYYLDGSEGSRFVVRYNIVAI